MITEVLQILFSTEVCKTFPKELRICSKFLNSLPFSNKKVKYEAYKLFFIALYYNEFLLKPDKYGIETDSFKKTKFADKNLRILKEFLLQMDHQKFFDVLADNTVPYKEIIIKESSEFALENVNPNVLDKLILIFIKYYDEIKLNKRFPEDGEMKIFIEDLKDVQNDIRTEKDEDLISPRDPIEDILMYFQNLKLK